jgi:hypothetical protein
MEILEHFHLEEACFTAATISLGVILGPEGIFTGVGWPATVNFTFVPPISITKTLPWLRVIYL